MYCENISQYVPDRPTLYRTTERLLHALDSLGPIRFRTLLRRYAKIRKRWAAVRADIRCSNCKHWYDRDGAGGTSRPFARDPRNHELLIYEVTCGHCGHPTYWCYDLAPVAVSFERSEIKGWELL